MNIGSPNRTQFPELQELWLEAFENSENYLKAFNKTAFSVERCRCVTIDSKLCAALYWFNCSYRNQRIAYLYAVATFKSHQGQGLCSALMEETHAHLKSLGYDAVILVPSSKKLFKFYEKFGYKTSCHIKEINCAALKDSISIRQIDADEYARCRRRWLPDKGVIQEGENLKYLQELALLYTGENFLLAAQPDGSFLRGVEFLGNVSDAPKILSALGFSHGRFRTPDNAIPFAMYRSLSDTPSEPPEYFGLAFE